MSQFLSPGVYVQEVPSAVQPIAGVGTSTAGFLGAFPTPASVPVATESVGNGDGRTKIFRLGRYPADTAAGKFTVKVANNPVKGASLSNDPGREASYVVFDLPPDAGKPISVDYAIQMTPFRDEPATPVSGMPTLYALSRYPVDTTGTAYAVRTVTKLAGASDHQRHGQVQPDAAQCSAKRRQDQGQLHGAGIAGDGRTTSQWKGCHPAIGQASSRYRYEYLHGLGNHDGRRCKAGERSRGQDRARGFRYGSG